MEKQSDDPQVSGNRWGGGGAERESLESNYPKSAEVDMISSPVHRFPLSTGNIHDAMESRSPKVALFNSNDFGFLDEKFTHKDLKEFGLNTRFLRDYHYFRFFPSQIEDFLYSGTEWRRKLPDSIIGHCHQLFLSSNSAGLSWGLSLYFPSIVLSVLVELSLVWGLWFYLPSLTAEQNDANGEIYTFCDPSVVSPHFNFIYQYCGVGVFLLGLSSALNDVWSEFVIVYFGKAVRVAFRIGTDIFNLNIVKVLAYRTRKPVNELSGLVKETPLANRELGVFLLCNFLLLIELSVYLSVAIVGVHYILVSSSPSNLISACVALEFLNRVDNMMYEAIAPAGQRSETWFVIAINHLDVPDFNVPNSGRHNLWRINAASLLFTVPVYVGSTIAIVSGLRYTHC